MRTRDENPGKTYKVYCKKKVDVRLINTRVLHRKGPWKNNQNLDDIVRRLNDLNPDVDIIPCFIAQNLGSLPPITFNSIDVSVASVLLTKMAS